VALEEAAAAGIGGAGAPIGLVADGLDGVMLRVTGAALLFSLVRVPRLPWLEKDDLPPPE